MYRPKVNKPSRGVNKALEQGTFGSWTTLSWDEDKYSYVKCKCVCGKLKSIRASSLISEDSTSCGCTMGTPCGVKFKCKKRSEHPMYKTYYGMQRRCYNKNSPDYKWYGGRGISVCDRWLSDFDNFLEDMELSYEKGLEIERLDVDGNYEPENCIWLTRKSQLSNTTRSRKLKGWGIELTTTEWSILLDFNGKLLDDRINKLQWEGDLEEVLSITFKNKSHKLIYKGTEMNASDIWKLEGFTEGQKNGRLNKYGDSLKALEAEGIEFTVVVPRDKEYRTFEEGLKWLRSKVKDPFEEHLLYKIEKQLEEL